MIQSHVSVLAILAAAVVQIVIGGFWYSPAGFGKAWMAMIGKTEADMRAAMAKGVWKSYVWMFTGRLL